jgi:hypothetical protein
VRAQQRQPLLLKGAARPVEAWEILRLVDPGGEEPTITR